MTRAVLFDLFGTLVPSPPADEYRHVVNTVAEIAGQEPDLFYPKSMSINDDRRNGRNRSSASETSFTRDGLISARHAQTQLT